jgi:general secretion pathway protein G
MAKPGRRQQRPTDVKVAVLIVSILSLACRDTLTCNFTARANREAALRHDLFEMRHAIDDFRADKQRYPESLDTLVRDHYLRTVPVDPITGSNETWIQVRRGGAVIDVQRAAKGTGCDGSEYRRW